MSICGDDVETTALPSELLILQTIFEFEFLEPVPFGVVVDKLKAISPQELVIINNVIIIGKSFFLAKRIKTWL